MSEFHRMVTYLYLYERGAKRHNVGFAKIEKRDSQCLIEIHMKNTGHSIPSAPVYFYARRQQKLPGILLGNMGLSRGNGDFKVILKGEPLAGSSYSLDDVKGIYIPLSEEIMFVSHWDDNEFIRDDFIEPRIETSQTGGSQDAPSPEQSLQNRPLEKEAPEQNQTEQMQAKHKTPKPSEEPPSMQAGKGAGQPPAPQEAAAPSPAADLKAAEAAPKQFEQNSRKNPFPPQMAQKPEPLPENWGQKWAFILENFPVMTPFAGDESTVCVRFELKDIRLLPRQHWYLGNNSFLLHGFFNYRYLILGCREISGKKRWFIGIPGVYQNPERVMATLFGFPEFRNEKSAPINTGEFGYWYRYLNE